MSYIGDDEHALFLTLREAINPSIPEAPRVPLDALSEEQQNQLQKAIDDKVNELKQWSNDLAQQFSVKQEDVDKAFSEKHIEKRVLYTTHQALSSWQVYCSSRYKEEKGNATLL